MKDICFMFGNRDAGTEIMESLETAIERHCQTYGVRVFVVGRYGGFDRMAAAAAVRVKKRIADMEVYILTPYHPAGVKADIPEGTDGTLYPDGMETVPARFAIVRANRKMIEAAKTVICWAARAGNAKQMLSFAMVRAKKGLLIVENLAEHTNDPSDGQH